MQNSRFLTRVIDDIIKRKKNNTDQTPRMSNPRWHLSSIQQHLLTYHSKRNNNLIDTRRDALNENDSNINEQLIENDRHRDQESLENNRDITEQLVENDRDHDDQHDPTVIDLKPTEQDWNLLHINESFGDQGFLHSLPKEQPAKYHYSNKARIRKIHDTSADAKRQRKDNEKLQDLNVTNNINVIHAFIMIFPLLL